MMQDWNSYRDSLLERVGEFAKQNSTRFAAWSRSTTLSRRPAS